MTLIDVPDWPKVTEVEFEAHLKQCPDYVRTGYIGAVKYYYRHSGKHFATVMQEKQTEEIYLKP